MTTRVVPAKYNGQAELRRPMLKLTKYLMALGAGAAVLALHVWDFTVYLGRRPQYQVSLDDGILIVHRYDRPGLSFRVPLIAGLIVAAVLIGIWQVAKDRRRSRTFRDDQCPSCGYDIRATPRRCPECGVDPLGVSWRHKE
jgi:hypothetical protein